MIRPRYLIKGDNFSKNNGHSLRTDNCLNTQSDKEFSAVNS